MTREPRIVEVMGRPIVLRAAMSLGDAARKLSRRRLAGAPVVDDARHYVGTISPDVLMEALIDAALHERPSTRVAELVDADAPTLVEDAPLLVAVQSFARLDVPHPLLPVLRGPRVVGVVTRLVVIRALARLLGGPRAPDAAALYLSAWSDPDAPFDARR